MKVPGKRVGILGIGKSGFESARFLKAQGYKIFASDAGASQGLLERAQSLEALGIEVETGRHTPEGLLNCDWILISPGINPASPIYRILRSKKIPLVSEIEAASWYAPTKKIIAVTGTAGKTTVTTLLGRVFQKATGKAIVCGNIGNPWIGELGRMNSDDFVILEVSSFQLMHCQSFRPRAGLLLNISPNHQDWHRDFREYVDAKLSLFTHQGPGDFALFRRSDRRQYFPQYHFRAEIFEFDQLPALDPNEAAVRLSARLFEIPEKTVNAALSEFQGIEHRLERVTTFQGVTYINDSKCTTTGSLAWALDKVPAKSVVLIAGGHPKSDDFHNVGRLVREKVKQAVLMGEARPLLRRAWEGLCPLSEAANFREAVETARSRAVPGDTVLLSPACASFDMFNNYEERGALFKKIVREWEASVTHV